MDNSKSKPAHSTLQQNDVLEEDLWDIEDTWDEDEIAAEGTTETSPVFSDPIPATDPAPPVEEPETPPEETEEPAPAETPAPTETPTSQETPSDGIKMPHLSGIEKIGLSVVTILFLGLSIWGYIFLRQQNNLGDKEIALEFPLQGKHLTLSNLETFWVRAEGESGIKIGAVVIPAATLVLAEESKQSGSLRITFYNEDDTSVGDPVAISFTNGQFPNGKKSISFSASDGFHEEGDYSSYGVYREDLWHIKITEAGTVNASSNDFSQLLETSVKPVSK